MSGSESPSKRAMSMIDTNLRLSGKGSRYAQSVAKSILESAAECDEGLDEDYLAWRIDKELRKGEELAKAVERQIADPDGVDLKAALAAYRENQS